MASSPVNMGRLFRNKIFTSRILLFNHKIEPFKITALNIQALGIDKDLSKLTGECIAVDSGWTQTLDTNNICSSDDFSNLHTDQQNEVYDQVCRDACESVRRFSEQEISSHPIQTALHAYYLVFERLAACGWWRMSVSSNLDTDIVKGCSGADLDRKERECEHLRDEDIIHRFKSSVQLGVDRVDTTGTWPWHSIREGVHHNHPNCQSSHPIPLQYLRQGTGGKPLCKKCTDLKQLAA